MNELVAGDRLITEKDLMQCWNYKNSAMLLKP